MNGKNNESDENHEDVKAGFQVNLPFNFGWIRGDRSHVSLLVPALKWALLAAIAVHLILRIIHEWKAS